MSKRIKFFTIHLLISILIATIFLVWIIFVWYPLPLFKATGVIHIILLLFTVDVIMGSLLGLIVYKEGKKTLKFDLIVIISLQLIALFYGSYHIFQGRPVWIVFNVDQFELVRENEIYRQNTYLDKERYAPSLWGPQYIAAKFSSERKIKEQQMSDDIFNGISLAQRPESYISLDQIRDDLSIRGKNLKELQKFNEITKVSLVLKDYPEANAWLPLKSNAIDMVVLINKKTATVIKIVDLRPWN